MAGAVAGWWEGLSAAYRGWAVIIAVAVGTAATVLSISEHLGLPARMDAAEAAIQRNTDAIRDVGSTLRTIEQGQRLTNCLLLAQANGSNPLECAR